MYFYKIGAATNSEKTEVIQDMARALGLGRTTGIDLADSTEGNVPDWKWRERIGEAEATCRKKKGIPLGADYSVYAAAAAGCGISDMRPWSIGDNVNLAVGQGDVQASPLQMAVAYSTIATDGRVPRPHLGLQIEDNNGTLVQRVSRAPSAASTSTTPTARPCCSACWPRRPRRAARRSTSGRAATGLGPGPLPGLRQDGHRGDLRPRGGLRPIVVRRWIKDNGNPDDPGIVIAVTVEKGGFGAAAAAPAAARDREVVQAERQGRVRLRRVEDELMNTAPIVDPGRPERPPRRGLARRSTACSLLAVPGICAMSLLTLHYATENDAVGARATT